MAYKSFIMEAVYIILITFLLCHYPSQAGRSCPVGTGLTYKNFFHWCLAYVDDPMSWQDARHYCQSRGSDLIKVEDSSENGFASTLLIHNEESWIGLHDRNKERKFNWTDGTPVEFTNWNRGEPNNYDNEDCVTLQPKGTWNDLYCYHYRPFICEAETVADCCLLDMPNYLIPSSNQTILGTVVTFRCAEGYYMENGNTTRTCTEDETWTGTMPACHRYDCGDPGEVAGASKTGKTFYGDQMVYQCLEGYYLASGNDTLACGSDKTWKGTKPVCKAGIHPSKRIKVTPIHKRWYIYVICGSVLVLVVVAGLMWYKRNSILGMCPRRSTDTDPLEHSTVSTDTA